LNGPIIQAGGAIRNPFGDYSASWITAADVGAMAASLLVDPGQVPGPLFYPTGGERRTWGEVAELITAEVRQPIRYQEISPEEWRQNLNVALQAGFMNSVAVDHLVAQSIILKTLPIPPLTDDVERLTGRRPTTLAKFITANRGLLTPKTP
jgi:uncharacterized protein YbjT (DUF2867 family)